MGAAASCEDTCVPPPRAACCVATAAVFWRFAFTSICNASLPAARTASAICSASSLRFFAAL